MGTFGKFQSWLKSTQGDLKEQVKKYKNKELLDAIVAGCAVVAYADGSISSEEKQKMAGFVSRSEDLKVFEMSDVISRFNHFTGSMEFDVMVGKQEALRAIAKFGSKQDIGRVIVGVCCAIAGSDGNFDDMEKQAVRDICNVLGLAPSEFGL